MAQKHQQSCTEEVDEEEQQDNQGDPSSSPTPLPPPPPAAAAAAVDHQERSSLPTGSIPCDDIDPTTSTSSETNHHHHHHDHDDDFRLVQYGGISVSVEMKIGVGAAGDLLVITTTADTAVRHGRRRNGDDGVSLEERGGGRRERTHGQKHLMHPLRGYHMGSNRKGQRSVCVPLDSVFAVHADTASSSSPSSPSSAAPQFSLFCLDHVHVSLVTEDSQGAGQQRNGKQDDDGVDDDGDKEEEEGEEMMGECGNSGGNTRRRRMNVKNNSTAVTTAKRKKSRRVVHDFVCSTVEQRDWWVSTLRAHLFSPYISSSCQEDTTHGTTTSPPSPQLNLRLRHALVIVNPFSGTKRAMRLFERHAVPILQVAHLTYDLVQTEGPGHATQLCREADLERYTEIITVGGDGIVSECLNGIMSRSDWKRAIHTPIGVLPGGTSNGLASSLLDAGSSMEVAAFHVARGFVSRGDIFSVFQRRSSGSKSTSDMEDDVRRMYGFMSVSWGFIADLDHGTESLRFLGGLRNDVGALARIVVNRSYEGTVRYLQERHLGQETTKEMAEQEKSRLRGVENVNVKLRDGGDREQQQQEPVKEIGCPLMQHYFPERASEFDLGSRAEIMTTDGNFSTIGGDIGVDGEAGQIVELSDRFIAAIAVNCSHIAYNAIMHPDARIDSGHLDLLLVRKQPGVGRLKLMSMFSKVDQGGHIQYEQVEKVRCRAMEIIPRTKGSFISIDGEAIDYMPTYVEVHPQLATFFVRHKTRYSLDGCPYFSNKSNDNIIAVNEEVQNK